MQLFKKKNEDGLLQIQKILQNILLKKKYKTKKMCMVCYLLYKKGEEK